MSRMNVILPSHQRGYTIVELLIAGTLGLVLLAGVGNLFLGSGQTFRMQRNLADIQDSGRFALWFLKDSVQQAGWPEVTRPRVVSGVRYTPLVPNDTEVPTRAELCPGDVCTANGGGTDSDALTVMFAGGADCTGSSADLDVLPEVGTIVQNRFYVDADTRQLMCVGNGGGAAQPLVSNVESFQVLYGVDSDPSPDDVVNQYVTADEVMASGNAGAVLALRFSLLVAGEQSSSIPAVDRSYIVGEHTLTFNDRVPRRVFNLTVPLRNRIPLEAI